MSAHSDNRADMPRYDVSLSSQADDAIARLRGHLRANNDEQRSIAQMETVISLFERQYHMTTYTFVQRWRAGDIENTISTLMWFNVARAAGYVALPPVPDTISPTMPHATEHALAANVGANSAVISTSPSGAGGTDVDGTKNDTDVSSELESVSSEIEALSVIAVQDDAPAVSASSVSTDSSLRGEGTAQVNFDRPSRPPKMSKLRNEIWDWIERHADNELSVNIVRDGTGRARGTCAEVLAMWRDWNPEMTRKDKAS
jgi:hypothetical protein